MHSLSISRLAVKCLLAVVCCKWFPVVGYKWLAVIALKCSKTAVVLATQLGWGGGGIATYVPMCNGSLFEGLHLRNTYITCTVPFTGSL